MASSTFATMWHRIGRIFALAGIRLTDSTSKSTTAYVEVVPVTGVPSGRYGRADAAVLIAIDVSSTDHAAAMYVLPSGSSTWKPFQPTDAELSALLGLTSAADKVPYFTGSGTAAVATFTSFGRTVVALADVAALRTLLEYASTSNGKGASLIGVEDTAASLVATQVEAALAELATPLTLTPGAESGNAIPVTVAGPAHVAQYIARVYAADMLLAESTAFTCAETGVGAEVSTTAKASLLFTTDANGGATITVTDVSGVFAGTVYLEVSPAGVPAGTKPGPSAIVAITFA